MAVNNTLLIQQLELLEWNYLGKCACKDPADKLTKEGFVLKLSRRRNAWNLLQDNKVVRYGTSDDLIGQIKGI